MSQVSYIWSEGDLFPETIAEVPAAITLHVATGDWAQEVSAARQAQAIIASSLLRYDAALLDQLPTLRLIARTGIGVDNIDLSAATARGIIVANTPDGPTESTAEHTVAMLLALAKRLKQGDANLADGKWGPRRDPLIGTEVLGKTLGLLGFGRIGRRVAEICRLAFGMTVLAYDPYIDADAAATEGVTLCDLDDVIAQADFLSLHMPATPETTHIINSASLARMKDGAYLLNMARGPLVDEVALLAALDAGKLAGAGLDVFDPEPPALDSGLRRHPNAIVTPHSASLTHDGRLRMERMALARVLAFAAGDRPENVVNPAVFGNADVLDEDVA